MTAIITITIITTTTIILTTNVILRTTVILTTTVTITTPRTAGVITAEIFSVTSTTAITDRFWKVDSIDVVTIYTKPGKVSELI